MSEPTDPALIPILDNLCAAILIDFADFDADDEVPIGRLLIEWFSADERGYAYEDDLPDLTCTVAELRDRARCARERLLHELPSPA
jgi:hypothetical protein